MLREHLLQGMQILVIEDSGAMSSVLAMMIRELGAKSVEVATTFDQALSCCEKNLYDGILMDIHLDHGTDGIALARLLRDRGWNQEAMLIFVTGNISRQTVEAALELEPDGYIAKPLSLAKLTRVFWNALKPKLKERIASQGAEQEKDAALGH